MSVLAIAGSPSHPSRTYSVLEYAKRHLEAERVSTTLFSVRDLPAEALLFAQFDDPAVKQAIALVEQASALIIATPVYKAAYTGVLKAFLDLLPQNALVGKPVLAIATGGAIAHLLSIDYALKPVLSTLGARHIFAGVYIVDSQIQRQPDGGVQFAEEVEQRLQISLNELIASLQPTQSLVSSAS
ncbi:MAG: NADPH-dependent FMN reductase [Leptolyngbyaceae cyanobacterium RM2_2_4]|nr:NADPH-dependent FMN reductase [Leptolyngbyaceae cyanobacterium SM1_4_3]NJO51825.1 NADPH-dependent FMN reductase [Leptolyngbyaceae cyanobacterium RM2_2_4]NJO66711.1 NADPH-dependent FMN reductase [Leptolyngbyaceae cyanobacterium RM1_405_57]